MLPLSYTPSVAETERSTAPGSGTPGISPLATNEVSCDPWGIGRALKGGLPSLFETLPLRGAVLLRPALALALVVPLALAFPLPLPCLRPCLSPCISNSSSSLSPPYIDLASHPGPSDTSWWPLCFTLPPPLLAHARPGFRRLTMAREALDRLELEGDCSTLPSNLRVPPVPSGDRMRSGMARPEGVLRLPEVWLLATELR